MNYDSGALSPDENKPIKTVSAKTKKRLLTLAFAALGIIAAAGAILIFSRIFRGAGTPQKAAAEYVRASLVYDIDGMIEYASPYAKVVLYGNEQTSDRLLKSYLKKAYAEYSAPSYSGDQIVFKLLAVTEYHEGDDTFEKIMKRYGEKADRSEVEAAAEVQLTVNDTKSEKTHSYIVVKIGPSWYYAYTSK